MWHATGVPLSTYDDHRRRAVPAHPYAAHPLPGSLRFATPSSVKRRCCRISCALGIVFFLTLPPAQSSALPLQAAERVAGRSIRAVAVRHPPTITLEEVRALLDLRPGQRLDPTWLRDATRRFFADGRFRQVRFGAREEETGVILELELLPSRVVGRVEIQSTVPMGTSWVRDRLALRNGDPVDQRALGRLRQRVESALAKRGWRAPAVGLALVPLDDAGLTEVVVRIDPGPHTRVHHLQVEGELPYPHWDLSLGLGPGRVLNLDRLEQRSSKLAARLRRDRYLDAVILAPRLEPVPSPPDWPRVNVILPVKVGLPVKVRILGNQQVSKSRLLEDAAVLEELGTGRAGLEELRERVAARYERLGFYRARVRVDAGISADGAAREVRIRIREGPGSYVVGLRFPGASVLPRTRLEDQVQETVIRFLRPELNRAGIDPELVERSQRSPPAGLYRRRPTTAAPDPERVYVPRAYRAAARALADLYRSAGYQSVAVEGPKTVFLDDERIEVEFRITEGIRWTVGALAFRNHEDVDPQVLFDAVGFDLGPQAAVPLVFEQVQDARRALVAVYANLGYAHVQVQEELHSLVGIAALDEPSRAPPRSIRATCADAAARSEQDCPVEVAFHIDPGPRVQVRSLVVRGLRHTARSVVEGELRLRPGEWMSREKMRRSRDNLVRLGVFDRVSVRPDETDQRKEATDLVVEIRPRKNVSLDVGGGASTEEGIRVFSRFAHRNLFGRALRLQTNAKVNLWTDALLAIYERSIRDQIRAFYEPSGLFGPAPLALVEFELAAGLSYPRNFQLPSFALGLDLIVLRDYDPAFSEDSQRATVIASYDGFQPTLLGRPRRLVAQLRLDLQRTDLLCNDAVSGRENLCSSAATTLRPGERAQGENFYFGVIPRLSWDFRDDPLLPQRGLLLELEAELAKGLDPQSPDYARVEGRLGSWVPLGQRFTLLLSVLGGRIFPLSSNVDIPLNRRFYAGGRSTIRGYPEQTLIPQDADLVGRREPDSSVSTGGLLYLAVQSELQFELFPPLTVAGFYDIGDLWRLREPAGICLDARVGLSTVCTLPDGERLRRRLAQGAGFGLRLSTPIGPLAVDFGFPVAYRYDAAETFTLHFSVGSR